MKRLLRAAAVLALIAALLGIILLPGALPAQAQSGNVWQVTYWPNADWAGYTDAIQYVSMLAFNWGTGSPWPGIPADFFTARATSTVYFSAGQYVFTVQADDEATLVIDNQTVINTVNQGQSGKTISVVVPLYESRNYNLRVDYREFTQSAYLFVNWALTTSAVPTPVPTQPTQPAPSATSVQTRYGDYTPCIQNGWHQSECFVSDGQWDSPDYGSIAMEPQIVIWGNCPANSVTQMVMFVGAPPQNAVCSKTEAGWFPQ